MGSNDQLSKLPVAGLLAIVIAAITAGLWTRQPLEVPRPKAEPLAQHHPSALQNIDARLWEDPLVAVARAEQQDAKGGASHAASLTANDTCLVSNVKAPARMLVIGVMMSNAPYPDVAEHRSRTRTALHAAMTAGHFVPDDPQHIGIAHIAAESQKPEASIPFEAFTRRPAMLNGDAPAASSIPFHVLVLWLEEEPIVMAVNSEPRPIWRIHHMLDKVQSACEAHVRRAGGGELRIESAVIGPATSDTLRAMVIEVSARHPGAASKPAAASGAGSGADNTRAPTAATRVGSTAKETVPYASEKMSSKPPVFYSAFATSSSVDLLRLNTAKPLIPCPDGADQRPWPLPDAHFQRDKQATGSALHWYFDRCKITFLSTIATDDKLATAIIDELRRRDPKGLGVDDPKYRIALVHEDDTYYGRNLPHAFLRAARKDLACEDDTLQKIRIPSFSALAESQRPCTVLTYGYLRGLDGGAAVTPNNDIGKPEANARSQAERTANEERAEGPKHYDYLHRLAGRMERENRLIGNAFKDDIWRRMGRYGETEIRAIGVFGSDVYDKIAVLRALRPQFPRAVFFTTDLDARMLDEDQNRWTRNLIVAASVGLELTPCLQKDAPPFRGSYQTSAFLSARLATHNAFPYEETGRSRDCPQYPLNFPAHTGEKLTESGGNAEHWRVKLSQMAVDKWLATPRLYEIGRTAPLALLNTPPRDAQAVGDVHAEADDFVPGVIDSLIGIVVFVALCVSLLMIARVRNRIVESWEFASEILRGRRGRVGWRALLGLLFVLFVTLEALIMFAYAESASREGEPFRWFQGISIWPSELMRAAAFCLALTLIFAAFQHSEKNLEHIEKVLGLKATSTDRGNWWEWWRNAWHELIGGARTARARAMQSSAPSACGPVPPQQERGEEVQACWAAYVRASSPEACFARAIIWTAAYMALGLALMEVSGYPALPARGAAAARLDCFLVYTAVPSFLLLLFVVAELTRRCNRFSQLLQSNWTWPEPKDRPALRGLPRSGTVNDKRMDRIEGVWMKVNVLAIRTRAISPLVFLPLLVLLLLVVARTGLFDGWGMPPGLAAILIASFIVCCGAGWMLHRGAEKVRTQSIHELEGLLLECASDATDTTPSDKQIQMVIDRIANLREGAFVPIWERPVVVAGLLPILGVGGLQLLQILELLPR